MTLSRTYSSASLSAVAFIATLALPLGAQELHRPKLIVTTTDGSIVTLQPGPGRNDGTDDGSAKAGKDTGAFGQPGTPNWADINFSKEPNVFVQTSTCNVSTGYAYIQFSLAGLPLQNIASAKVQLYLASMVVNGLAPLGVNPTFAMRRVTASWDETTLTWNRGQPTFDTTILDSQVLAGVANTRTTVGAWLTFDITALYRSWASGATPNYGVRLSHENAACLNGWQCRLSISNETPESTCSVSLSSSSTAAPPAAGTGTFTVNATGTACSWSVHADSSWIHVTSGASGTATGPVSYSLDDNTGAARSGTITIIAGAQTLTFTVNQAPAPVCSISLSVRSEQFPAGGGSANFLVTAPSGCPWSVAKDGSWITITSSASGSGSGSVTYAVAANATTATRSGSITVGSQVVTITQAGAAPCTYVVQPTSLDLPGTAGSGTITLTTGIGCAWQVTSPDWINVTPASGSGSGVLELRTSANSSTNERRATLTIGGQAVAVRQAGAPPCHYLISPDTLTFPDHRATASLALTADDGCEWNAGTSADWIMITPNSGTGSATLKIEVRDNREAADRQAGVGIATQSLAVTQSGRTRLTPEEVVKLALQAQVDGDLDGVFAQVCVDCLGEGGGVGARPVLEAVRDHARFSSFGFSALATAYSDGDTYALVRGKVSFSVAVKSGNADVTNGVIALLEKKDGDWKLINILADDLLNDEIYMSGVSAPAKAPGQSRAGLYASLANVVQLNQRINEAMQNKYANKEKLAVQVTFGVWGQVPVIGDTTANIYQVISTIIDATEAVDEAWKYGFTGIGALKFKAVGLGVVQIVTEPIPGLDAAADVAAATVDELIYNLEISRALHELKVVLDTLDTGNTKFQPRLYPFTRAQYKDYPAGMRSQPFADVQHSFSPPIEEIHFLEPVGTKTLIPFRVVGELSIDGDSPLSKIAFRLGMVKVGDSYRLPLDIGFLAESDASSGDEILDSFNSVRDDVGMTGTVSWKLTCRRGARYIRVKLSNGETSEAILVTHDNLNNVQTFQVKESPNFLTVAPKVSRSGLHVLGVSGPDETMWPDLTPMKDTCFDIAVQDSTIASMQRKDTLTVTGIKTGSTHLTFFLPGSGSSLMTLPPVGGDYLVNVQEDEADLSFVTRHTGFIAGVSGLFRDEKGHTASNNVSLVYDLTNTVPDVHWNGGDFTLSRQLQLEEDYESVHKTRVETMSGEGTVGSDGKVLMFSVTLTSTYTEKLKVSGIVATDVVKTEIAAHGIPITAGWQETAAAAVGYSAKGETVTALVDKAVRTRKLTVSDGSGGIDESLTLVTPLSVGANFNQ